MIVWPHGYMDGVDVDFKDLAAFNGGGFLKVASSVGSLSTSISCSAIAGTSEYTDCTGLLATSSSAWPDTALSIAASGVYQDKLVIGKPATVADASNGYADPATLATCISTAVSKGWNGGITVWLWPNAESAGIENVRGTAVPAEEEQQPRLPQAHISHDVDECHLNSFR
ncbi:glycoside hydrolase family 18 protein [Athelia psychrophila]|uniref:Glycoside hydrolase family 18 protein n=1 Tax=Athelia psychrophila TaxID=1759441 RepID=A0A166GQI9_9AGAM|nr:glycoside hydrolase family 18 protein [Fibularhizoctonia sp. CBS 109695]